MVIETDDYIIATVCDGCSDSVASEVGSNLICRIFNARMAEYIEGLVREIYVQEDIFLPVQDALEEVRVKCIEDILAISSKLDKNHLVGIKDFFLSTIVSVIITREITFVCSIGDGIVFINGEPYEIGPFVDNEPPYIAYGAVDPNKVKVAKELYRFNLVKSLPTNEFHSVLIGSDGVEDVIKSEFTFMPGKGEVVGNVSQFWTHDNYFANKSLLGRKLNLYNTDSRKIDWEGKRMIHEKGLLHDDTTIIAIRRRWFSW